jgi:catechol 2,3-dioxygenase-like lactoylglutathione lyase family enzyme
MSFHVDDFDAVLARIPTVGATTITPPMGPAGDRRVCLRDLDGFIIEVMERDPLDDLRPARWPQAGSAIRAVSLSVPDLEKARRFWVETLSLEVVDPTLLHTPEMEALWGLPGAQSETLLLRAGDQLIEVQQYRDPAPRPRPLGYLLSDVGILNIALGYRTRETFTEAFTRLIDNGYTANVQPNDEGPFTSSYVNDDQGFSLEMFHCAEEIDGYLGFMPEGTWRSATGRPPR